MAAGVYAGVLGAFAVLVLATGDFLLVLTFGTKYAGYGLTMGVLALGMVALSLGLTAGVGLWAIDRPKANLTADFSALAVTIVLILCLVVPAGRAGARRRAIWRRSHCAAVRYRTFRRLLQATSDLVEG